MTSQKSLPDEIYRYQPRTNGLKVVATVSTAVCLAALTLLYFGRLPFLESVSGTKDGARALVTAATTRMIQVGEPDVAGKKATVQVRLGGQVCAFVLTRTNEDEDRPFGWRIAEQACKGA